jgi:hypothetical protein
MRVEVLETSYPAPAAISQVPAIRRLADVNSRDALPQPANLGNSYEAHDCAAEVQMIEFEPESWRRRPDLNRGGGFADLSGSSKCRHICDFAEEFCRPHPPESAQVRPEWLAVWLAVAVNAPTDHRGDDVVAEQRFRLRRSYSS